MLGAAGSGMASKKSGHPTADAFIAPTQALVALLFTDALLPQPSLVDQPGLRREEICDESTIHSTVYLGRALGHLVPQRTDLERSSS